MCLSQPQRPRYTSNEIEEQTDMMSFRTKSGRNKVRFEFVSAVRYSSPKQSFVQSEFFFASKNFWATIGPWKLLNQWVFSGAPPSLMHNFFPLVNFSFNKGQAGEHHLQVTSNMNTLCRIADLPQIYPHLYYHSQGDFKDSEIAFNSKK